MKKKIISELKKTLPLVFTEFNKEPDTDFTPALEIPHNTNHGEYYSNVAMVLAKQWKTNPRNIATAIQKNLNLADLATSEIAGNGFINFKISPSAKLQIVANIINQGALSSDLPQARKVLLEYVSANPTGPLHVGHGRSAAIGDTLANMFRALKFTVTTEYYVNDSGRQMDILALSVWLRYLESYNFSFNFPANIYQGNYIKNIAEDLKNEVFDKFCKFEITEFNALETGDTDKSIDNWIKYCRQSLDSEYKTLHNFALNQILDSIKNDLKSFGVLMTNYFHESLLNKIINQQSKLEEVINKLKANGHLYCKDGAWWFNSCKFGDDKDRVVIRENGQYTYFALDIAYHAQKFEQGYDLLLNIFGADHHGYTPRLKASMQALGFDTSNFEVILVQFANLYRDKKKISMSTRSGEFVTLNQLIGETSQSVARFFYTQRKSEQHLDFDLNLAVSKQKENPLYYIQYAHARICQLFEKTKLDYDIDFVKGTDNLDLITDKYSQALAMKLWAYQDMLVKATLSYEVHKLSNYLTELAEIFHLWYTKVKVIDSQQNIAELQAKLALCKSVQLVIKHGLELYNIKPLDSM